MLEPTALWGIAIECKFLFVITFLFVVWMVFKFTNKGAFFSPNSKQGKNVGVMYSALTYLLTMFVVIVESSNAGA